MYYIIFNILKDETIARLDEFVKFTNKNNTELTKTERLKDELKEELKEEP
jgi:hypothetical protein